MRVWHLAPPVSGGGARALAVAASGVSAFAQSASGTANTDFNKSPRHRAISGHGHICLGQGKIGVDNGL
ncbi:hypothetical protein DPMD02_0 [Desulfofustis phage LS06-2018-MD02]|nr:hypothetical protein DPMD02_0 [Desulfofustis phage LS06-2018-MD02]